MDEVTQVEKDETVKGKLVFSFSKPTPKWATNSFRAVFLLTTALTIWIAATRLIPDANKSEIMLGLKCVDLVIWGFARSLGIEKKNFEN